MNARFSKIDNIKGLLIALVVFGHAIEVVPLLANWQGGGVGSAIYAFIYLFHMPGFVFISGYLSSPTKSATDNFREIFLMYVLAHTAWIAFCLLLSFAVGTRPPATAFLAITPGWGLWYLLSLFFWRLSVPILASIRYPAWCLLGLCLYAACVGRTELGETLSASRTLCFLPFFAGGFWSRQKAWWLTESRFAKLDILLFGIGLVIAPYLLMKGYSSIALLHHSAPYPIRWPEGMAFRLGFFVVAFAFVRLLWLCAPSRMTALAIVGVNSISVYLLHFYILQPLRVFLPEAAWRTHVWWIAPLVTLVCCLLAPLRFAALFERAREVVSGFLFQKHRSGS